MNHNDHIKTKSQLLKELGDLKNQNKRLSEALQPFANMGREVLLNSNLKSPHIVYAYNRASITVDDLKLALDITGAGYFAPGAIIIDTRHGIIFSYVSSSDDYIINEHPTTFRMANKEEEDYYHQNKTTASRFVSI